MEKSEKKKSGRLKIIIIIVLALLLLISVGVTIWALCFRDKGGEAAEDSSTVLTPDYAPQETEKYAETMGDESDEKLSQAEGGGAVSLTYSNEVTISLEDNIATLLFGNPTRSNQDMVLQLIIQDEIIAQSGRLTPGNQVTKLDLEDGAAEKLSAGGYEGKFVVLYYDQDTAEKAMVNTEIPVTITVE